VSGPGRLGRQPEDDRPGTPSQGERKDVRQTDRQTGKRGEHDKIVSKVAKFSENEEYFKAKRNSNFKERIIAKKGGRTWHAEKNKNNWEENAEKKWKAGFLLF
jgi:hypothetical protein